MTVHDESAPKEDKRRNNMKIKALVPFSTGTISMEQYEVREVTDSLGNELISAGVAVEIGGGGLPPVTESDNGKVATVVGGEWSAQESRQMTTGAYDDTKYYIYIKDLQTDPSFEGRLRARVHGLDVLDDIKNNRIMTARIMLNMGDDNYEPIADIVFQPSYLRWGNGQKNLQIQTSIIDLNQIGVDQRAVIVSNCTAMQGDEHFDDPLFGTATWLLL